MEKENLIPSFEEYVNEQKLAEKEELETNKDKKEEKVVEEKEVTDKESFKEYVFAILKKQHGDDFDEKKAQKMVDDLAKEVDGDDWGEVVGKVQNG